VILIVGIPKSSSGRIRSPPLSISFRHGFPWSCVSWGWTTGPLVAAVQRHSLTPSTWTTYGCHRNPDRGSNCALIERRTVSSIFKVTTKIHS
jgi:hypothetical protein